MDIKVGFRTIDLLKKISERKVNDISYVKYSPQKPKFPDEIELRQAFERSEPEAQGVSSAFLERFIEELQSIPETVVHSLMILRNGKVIAEGSFAPYREEVWHISHSLCKSVVSLAVGIAIAEGRFTVESKVNDLLKNRKPVTAITRKNLQVKHLLMMSSGILVSETAAVTGNEWTKSCLESAQRFEPGKKFHYNSMNTYLLSVILHEVTGEGLIEYLKPRLFEPLGIDRIHWELSPEGIEKGGWGMYMCLEDMAKLGQLCLQEGEWNGKQLVPREWIADAGRFHIDSTSGKGKYGYGYQMWLGKRPGSFLFNGMLGQIVYVIPDLSMVFVLTGGSDNLYRDNMTNLLIEKYFDESFVPQELSPDPKAAEQLRSECRHLSYPTASLLKNAYTIGGTIERTPTYEMERQAVRLNGKEYEFPPYFAGLMPLFIQCVHNNYSKGIEKVGFRWGNETDSSGADSELRPEAGLTVIVTEGKNVNRIPVGFAEAKYCDIYENGEAYRVAALGTMIRNEDDVPVLKLMLFFIETSNVRIIKIWFDKKSVHTQFYETPGIGMMLEGIDSVVAGVSAPAVVTSAMAVLDEEYIENKLKAAFDPEAELKPLRN